MKMNLSQLTPGTTNLSVNITASAREDGKVDVYVSFGKNVQSPRNSNENKSCNFNGTPAEVKEQINAEFGLGLLFE